MNMVEILIVFIICCCCFLFGEHIGHHNGAVGVTKGEYACTHVEINDSWQCGYFKKVDNHE